MAAPVGAPLSGLKQLGKRRTLLALGLGVVLFLVWRNRSSGQTGIVGTTDPTATTTATDPLAGGLVTGSSVTGTPDTTASAAALEGLTSGLIDAQTQLAQLQADSQAAIEAALQAQQTGNDIASTPTATTPAGTITSKPPTVFGFWWDVFGKRIFVTKQNSAAFVRSEQAQGGRLDVWAYQHPAAARSIGILPPPAPPATSHPAASPVPHATVAPAPVRVAAPTPTPVYVHSPGANPVAAARYTAAVAGVGKARAL